MSDEVNTSRRGFLKALIGLSAVAAVGGIGKSAVQSIVTPSVGLSGFPETMLYWIDPASPNSAPVPLKVSQFAVMSPQVWVYYYPLSDEPNFLIKFPDPVPAVPVDIDATGQIFNSPPGVGPNNSLVSFSAICQHLGCIPPIIHYYPPNSISQLPSNVQSSLSAENKKYGVIHCNCHGSTYDPFKGASIITHPTQRPLPNVVLSYNSITDSVFAKKLVGPTVFGHPSDLSGGNSISNLKKTTLINMSSA
ncbi:MAG: Rieske 2Fe-2S domain-containing protein [Candidatus Thermoplasmatota archaeon]|jgi:Rieske Fe-S protein|nr:Rieske 2Fe-2S domain-containing protein [Candidatus Thermoplasmatota archaeon]MCL5987714.1 Rieske 2Fe-2S domain-containing protein [Candidatus Thermoplasmatota archaeon]